MARNDKSANMDYILAEEDFEKSEDEATSFDSATNVSHIEDVFVSTILK